MKKYKVSILVNLPDDKVSTFDDLTRYGISEAFRAVRILYPTWTSMVLTVVNPKAE